MKNNLIKSATLIETHQQLIDMVSKLSNESMVGVDTESNSLYEYQEKICLIQFSTRSQDYLVDTIILKDLSPLKKIFKSREIEKIFHAAEYDLMCLKRDFQFEFNNIFDTMIASKILGFRSVGLQSLLNKFFDVVIEKKFQRANWGKRPLPIEMQRYAQTDTHYLIKLREILYELLIQEKKWELASEDFNRLTNVEPFINNKNNDHYWKIIKGKSLTPQQESVLIEIYFLREDLAKQMNRPPFKIFGNNAILDIAKKLPKNENQLKIISELSPKLIQKYGDLILQSVLTGLSQGSTIKKEKYRPDPVFVQKYEALKNWRKNKGMDLSVESDVILPKEHMEIIAHKSICKLSEIKEIMHDIPFRYQKFGKEIFDVLKGIE